MSKNADYSYKVEQLGSFFSKKPLQTIYYLKALDTLIPNMEKFLKNFENFENFRGSKNRKFQKVAAADFDIRFL